MQKLKTIIPGVGLCLCAALTTQCKDADGTLLPRGEQTAEEMLFEVKGDSMRYGLVCDGTSDSVIVLWPFGGEPVVYNSIDAKHSGRIIGKLQIGDWTGVMLNNEDTTEVVMAINLDQLKGTWTYPVMPVMKDLQNMSKRMRARMMADMPDSVKNAYLIPREYGFTLKRGHKAQAVGHVMRSNTLEDDSPVVYPKVQPYQEWHMLNGRLLLVSKEINLMSEASHDTTPTHVDTLDFKYMDADSLILEAKGKQYHFHRKQNALKANEAAIKAAEK